MKVWVYRQNNNPQINPAEIRESDEKMAVACAEDDDFDIYFFSEVDPREVDYEDGTIMCYDAICRDLLQTNPWPAAVTEEFVHEFAMYTSDHFIYFFWESV